MKKHLLPLLLAATALLPSLRATTIWQGDPNTHYSVTTDDDVVLGFEGDDFNIYSAIVLGGTFGQEWQGVLTHHTFFLTPDAGWEFTSFNGAATDRGSYRNSYPGGHVLDTQISVADLAFTDHLENYWEGSGGSFTIKYFTPWFQTFALDGSAAHGLTITLDQQLWVYNGSYFGTDVGFGFSLQQSTVSEAVPETGPTLGLFGLALAGLIGVRRKSGAI